MQISLHGKHLLHKSVIEHNTVWPEHNVMQTTQNITKTKYKTKL